MRDYHATAAATSLGKPMLFLQGERDYQVTMTDFELWKKALARAPNITFRSYQKLNHLFLPGDGRSSPKEYDRQEHVPEEIIQDIAGWLAALRA